MDPLASPPMNYHTSHKKHFSVPFTTLRLNSRVINTHNTHNYIYYVNLTFYILCKTIWYHYIQHKRSKILSVTVICISKRKDLSVVIIEEMSKIIRCLYIDRMFYTYL